MRGFSIGKLAKAAKVSIHTIRFYEKCGLLPKPPRRPSGFREYSDLDVLQLQFVREARALGFSLEQIAELLASDETEGPATIGSAVEHKLALVDRKIAELDRWRRSLKALRGDLTRRISRRLLLACLSADQASDVTAEL
jgi:MerR family copper efflux transcriptional regulator